MSSGFLPLRNIMKTIVTATGQEQIDKAIQKLSGFNTVASTLYRDELEDTVSKHQPDILLITNFLVGQSSLVSALLRIKTKYPNIRIVYLSGEIDLKNERELNSLNLLILSGIYDIIDSRQITLDMINRSLSTEKTIEDISHITKAINEISGDKSLRSGFEFVAPEEFCDEDDNVRNKLFVISSIKPGTGKSFVSANVATAIAAYGEKNEKGERPRVGLIEADLQNLSLGTLLQIEDNEKNVKTAMMKISEIITDEGELVGTPREIEGVNDFLKKCFIPYYHIKNLKALVGSHLTFSELQDEVKGFHYSYLIDSIIDEFDVLIVDTNSALTHVTTYPLLHMANSCYYILNLDFNNIRNNQRYKETLEEIGVSGKVKYILNEDVTKEDKSDESLIFTADHLNDSFELEAKIPVIPKTVFLNRLYEGRPIILDETGKYEDTRHEILKIANQIYPIKGFSNRESKNKKRRFI